MTALWNNNLHRVWILLIVATTLGYMLRGEGHAGLSIGLATLAIAYLKGRLIVLDFMELRHAPLLWRALLEGWLLLISVLVFAIYGTGMPAN